MKSWNRLIGGGRHPWRRVWQPLTWLMMVSLAGCSWFGGGSATPTLPSLSSIVPAPHLTVTTVGQLLEAAGPYRVVEANEEIAVLTCSVFEASECWFGESYLEGPLGDPLSEQVIAELGRDFVANGEFNQVRLRCSRTLDGGAVTCQVDLGRGSGWESLPVEP